MTTFHLPAEFDVISLARAATVLHQHPAAIYRACQELGLTVALQINSVPHFSAGDIDRLASYFAQKDDRHVAQDR